MRKSLVILMLLSTLISFSNNSKKIIVALSLNDCISCTAPLNQINSALNNPEILFVFKSELEPDSLLVNKRTGIDNYKSSSVKYSDTLFNEYANGIKSTINIIENNKKIYSADLYRLNVNEFVNIYSNKENPCYSNLKQGARLIQYDQSLLIYSSQLSRWSYYDKDHSLDIIADEEWVKRAYDIYYDKNEVEEKYIEIINLAKQYPAVNPSIDQGKKINEEELLFMTRIKFIEKKLGTEEEVILQKVFLVTYSIEKKSIISVKYINGQHPLLRENNYFPNSSHFYIIDDNNYIIPLRTEYDSTETDKYLSVFEINKNNPNELILKEIINNNIPNNYIKYKIYRSFQDYLFNKSLVLLRFGEFIYDYKKDTRYKIPFPENEYSTLNNLVSEALKTGKISSYYIHDIFDKDESILLLYKDSSKNLKLMEIDKKTEKALKDSQLLSSIELESYTNKSSFTFNENGEVQFLYNDNCIMKVEKK
ncbi:hypothetical protein SAMN02927937_00736 [Paenimyroides aquimaris]|uniref:Uncharacterized protein n=1 Tax=Paenimyroides marinum TaxID=1159016 RepID=A0A1H6JZ72_9FLAO|nr:hypothetical protein [Paenimyroides aquimaris]SEH65932.1 hypothetical protein SAMN02927937_00736 [Paenimyroides aquimaris]